jgi:CelD/BcsL family acetyltransferase involved in cellulose biosynthesis
VSPIVERIPIETLGAFDAIRPEWDELRRADPHATVFLTSGWLRAFLSMSPTPWSILTLRAGGVLVAALPISMRGAPHHRLPLARVLTFASAPFADYQGMLCRPEYEDAAIEAFAETLRALAWQRADFPDVRDPRIGALAHRLSGAGTLLHELPAAPCHRIDLPPAWDAYLATLSKPTRRATLRPAKQMAEELPAARTSFAEAANLDLHIDALLRLNALRWGTSGARQEKFRRLFRAAFAEGCLRIAMLWDGERPIGAGAALVDAERGYYGWYLIGHDPEYARFSPGKAALASGIQDALGVGCRTFDFMRGGEGYKSSYATGESTNAHFTLRRRGARAALLRAIEPGYMALRSALVRLRAQRSAA